MNDIQKMMKAAKYLRNRAKEIRARAAKYEGGVPALERLAKQNGSLASTLERTARRLALLESLEKEQEPS